MSGTTDRATERLLSPKKLFLITNTAIQVNKHTALQLTHPNEIHSADSIITAQNRFNLSCIIPYKRCVVE